MDIKGLLHEKRAEILQAAQRHGAYNVRIFGSVATGESGEGSDIDLLVKASSSTSPWFPASLIIELQELLDRSVDVVTEDALHWYIRDRILAEAVPL